MALARANEAADIRQQAGWYRGSPVPAPKGDEART
jgi:hypothetical protein